MPLDLNLATAAYLFGRDSTAPVVTSAASASVEENATLSFALTASEPVTWAITGGADAAQFEISGSTLRWAANGTQDYESPSDANIDNAYIVQVTATDLAGNIANKTITITVTDVAEGDALELMLSDLATAGKLVSAWFLPLADPGQYLTLNGANVEGWAASHGTHPVDLAFETAAPQWDATLFSNKGGATFNGTDQCLMGDDINILSWPGATDDLWMLVAVRQDIDGAAAGATRALSYGSTAATTRGIGRSTSTSTNRVSAIMGASGILGATADLSGAHTIGLHVDIGGTSTAYVDGVADGTVATATAALTVLRVRLGASALASASQFWSGAIVGGAILNATASGTDFTDLEALFDARIS
jgi:hypothetical protein